MDAPVVGGSGGLFQVCSTVSAFLSLCVRQVGGGVGCGHRRFNVAENGSASYSPSASLPLSVPVRSDERAAEGWSEGRRHDG